MTDDRSEMQANRAAGLAKRHERRLAHARRCKCAYPDDPNCPVHGDFVIPEEALTAASKALAEAVCTCPKGRNQYGGWYTPQPTCPACGDSQTKARVTLEAALPHLRAHQVAVVGGEAMPTGRERPGEHWNARIIREEAETKALAETATKLGYELGRKEALADLRVVTSDMSYFALAYGPLYHTREAANEALEKLRGTS